MTTLEQALLNTELTPFEGKAVRQVGLEAPSAGGGLRESMRIDPVELHQGDMVVTIMEHRVAKVRFEPIDKDDPGGDQRRVHVLTTETAAIASGELVDLVRSQLAVQADKIKAARAAAKGYDRLPYADDEATAALSAAHADGHHAELAPGCPECQAETDAKAAEVTDEQWEASGAKADAPTPIAGRKPRAKKAGG